MSRRHPKRRLTGKHFAMIPVEVLTSNAFTSLPNYAVRVLIAIAAQYRGHNNGDLALTWSISKTFGVSSKEHLVRSLEQLLEHNLLEKTRQGGKKPLGPTLYAITWMPIDELRPKIETGPTTSASNTWATWTGLPADQSEINRRDCRQTASGLPADQITPISGLPADQASPVIGTAGSPPSRVSPEGASNRMGNGARSRPSFPSKRRTAKFAKSKTELKPQTTEPS